MPSARRDGLLRGGLDAYRGVSELGTGQPLTGPQVARLAPFLASTFRLPEPTVRGDLEAVRIYTRGLAANQTRTAVTVGPDMYVPGADDLRRITSWEGRGWLAHELGHTMQWRRTDPQGIPGAAGDLERTRRFLKADLVGFAVDDHLRPGGIPRGIAHWVRARLDHAPGGPPPPTLAGAIHDAHHLEAEAERAARAFAT